MSRGLRVLVSGRLVGTPGQGGATWAVLQYILGMRRLGHSVLFVEPVDPPRQPGGAAPSDSVVSYFRGVVDRFGLAGEAALVAPGGHTIGMGRTDLVERARTSDLLINLSGVLRDPGLTERIPVRAYVDLDPAFTQLWAEAEGIDMGFDGHTHFVTVGLEIGRTSPVPTCGRSWIPTVPPVVLEEWPATERIARDAWTTVANWRAYGSITDGGELYGQKAHAIRELIDLPAAFPEKVEIALAIHPDERADLEAMERGGWTVLAPERVADGPDGYRSFVSGSRGEIGVAKTGYVRSRSGWFSDRSVCYLASGRPVVAQETGFSAHLPTGLGLFAFDSVASAAEAADRVRRDYRRHARAARDLAEARFASERVLSELIGALGGVA